MTPATSFDTTTTDPTGASLDAVSTEPAEADELGGGAVVDDPADADAPGDQGLVVAPPNPGTGVPGNGHAADATTTGGGTSAGGQAAVAATGDSVAPAEGGSGGWVRVCALDQLTPDRGRAALVSGQQVAVFRLSRDGAVYAIGNRDPFSGAHVLSRGIVGDKGGVPKVASPVFKQSFDLRTGQCLDDPDVSVPAHRVEIEDGWILIEAPPGSRSS